MELGIYRCHAETGAALQPVVDKQIGIQVGHQPGLVLDGGQRPAHPRQTARMLVQAGRGEHVMPDLMSQDFKRVILHMCGDHARQVNHHRLIGQPDHRKRPADALARAVLCVHAPPRILQPGEFAPGVQCAGPGGLPGGQGFVKIHSSAKGFEHARRQIHNTQEYLPVPNMGNHPIFRALSCLRRGKTRHRKPSCAYHVCTVCRFACRVHKLFYGAGHSLLFRNIAHNGLSSSTSRPFACTRRMMKCWKFLLPSPAKLPNPNQPDCMRGR